jgi:ribonuclease R
MRVRKSILKELKAAERGMSLAEIAAGPGKGIRPGQLRETLAQLVRSGQVTEHPPGHFQALASRGELAGRLSVNPRGYGFVATAAGDVYVAGRDMHGAMHRDVVAVRLFQRTKGMGQSGEVLRVDERANDRIVGRFDKQGRMAIVTPTDRRIQGDVFVGRAGFGGAADGQIVVVRVTQFAGPGQAAQGVVEEVLGLDTEPGVDVEIVIREHGLRTAFPGNVAAAAEAIPDAIGPIQPERTDLRQLLTVTIDPVDARDFDDAISLESRDGGGWRLWVHIADVSHYVEWGSPIDEEAVLRATSVYLVDRVLPMLPPRLSNGICSLNPGVDRFTMTVEFDLDAMGAPLAHRLYPSVIRSDHRLDYDAVDHMLQTDSGWPDDDAKRMLRGFKACSAALGRRRVDRGGLDFESVEPKVWLDPEGKPLSVTLHERSVATNMIEEAMIAANEVVARHMRDAEAPMVYRIHEDPDPDALAAIAPVLKEFDYPVKDIGSATPRTFQKLIAYAAKRPERLLMNSLLLRALQRARYVDYLDTHFGLASEAYCHFTSPIRRYPDLIVHRLLKAQLAGALDKDPVTGMIGELDWLADHSSQMEREADAAEKDSVKVKLTELMAQHVGETFDGIVTGVTTQGAYVQLDNTAEGFVHVSRMKDDYFELDAEHFLLRGTRSGRTWRLGQQVRVKVTDAIVSDRRIEMEWA